MTSNAQERAQMAEHFAQAFVLLTIAYLSLTPLISRFTRKAVAAVRPHKPTTSTRTSDKSLETQLDSEELDVQVYAEASAMCLVQEGFHASVS